MKISWNILMSAKNEAAWRIHLSTLRKWRQNMSTGNSVPLLSKCLWGGRGVEWAGLIDIGLLVVEYHHLTICSPSVGLISYKTFRSSLICKISFREVALRAQLYLLIKCLLKDIFMKCGWRDFFLLWVLIKLLKFFFSSLCVSRRG